MRLLLDSHTLIWSIDDPTRLSATALATIPDPANDRLVSAATIWELSIKVGQKKIALSLPYRAWMDKASIEWPPRSKKLSSTPILVICKCSCQTSAIKRSISVRGTLSFSATPDLMFSALCRRLMLP